MEDRDRFVNLGHANRIWAIGAIHGNVEAICTIHDQMADKLRAGDKLVYLGNYLGYGYSILPTLQEILRFRRWFLSIPPLTTNKDIVFLRGRQEEMWQKLRQLQFAPKPEEILNWVKDRGVSQSLEAFGLSVGEGLEGAAEGTLALTYWTTRLKEVGMAVAGHDAFLSSLKHAAYSGSGEMLFVSSGIDTTQLLSRQIDSLWWSGRNFKYIDAPYGGFQKIIRGYDPLHEGYMENDFSLSLDTGNPNGSSVISVCLGRNGVVEDYLKTN